MGFQPTSNLVEFKPYSLYKSTVNEIGHINIMTDTLNLVTDVCLHIVVSNTYCVLFCFSYVPYVASFSGLSFFDCPFGNVYLNFVTSILTLCDAYLIQLYTMILWQVADFIRVLLFSPPLKQIIGHV